MRRAARLLALALPLVLAACGGGGEAGSPTTAAPAQTARAATGTAPAAVAGEVVFRQNCTGCHTLRAAGATGKVGPNLDQTQPTAERVEHMVRNGGSGGLGSMPRFEGSLSDEQILAVSRYVADAAGR